MRPSTPKAWSSRSAAGSATHANGAETILCEVARKDRNRPLALAEALALAKAQGGVLLANAQSRRAAVQLPAPSLTLDDGTIERRVRLVRPMERPSMAVEALDATHWKKTDARRFSELWTRELESVPSSRPAGFMW